MRLMNVSNQIRAALIRKRDNITKRFVFPERYKGTILEKWANYWRQLGIDYKDVFVGIVKDSKDHPMKATLYAFIGSSSIYCFKTNPNEQEFYKQLREHNDELGLVNESCQNPESVKHMMNLETCINQGLLRYFSLGLASVIWVDNYSDSLSLYKTTCKYLQPEYMQYYNRIVDIGFVNTWWVLKKKMKDYDVNN